MSRWQPRALDLRAGRLQSLQSLAARGQAALNRHPLSLKLVQTAAGCAFGDVLAQTSCFTRRPRGGYQVWRTASMGAAGLLFAGPIQYAGLEWMHAHVLPARKTSVAARSIKFVADNILGCALWQVALISIDRSYRAEAARLLDRQGALKLSL